MTKKVQNFYPVLGCKVGSTPKDILLKSVRERLTISRPLFVITPNAENVLGVSKDEKLQKLLRNVDYAPADSVGLVAAAYFLHLPRSSRVIYRVFQSIGQVIYTAGLMVVRPSTVTALFPLIKGRELCEDLIQIADKENWRIYLLGGLQDEAELTMKVINKRYPKLVIRSASGPLLNHNALPISMIEKQINDKVIKEVSSFRPHLLFVAFNFPKQERWLAENLSTLPVGLGMTVGGTFNYLSGKSVLPPKWLSQLGLEWFWRLLHEPWRAPRIFRAVVLFPLTVFRAKIFS